MRTAVACACLAAALPAQEQVTVRSALDAEATRRAADWCRARLPELRTAIEPAAAPELVAAVRARGADIDVVLGLDALLAAELADEGLLASAAGEAAGLALPYRDPQDRFVVPLLAPLAFAFDRRVLERADAPADYDDLAFDARFGGQIVLCEPEALPALWAGLLLLQLEQGRSEEQGFQWLRAIDARVASYEVSVAGALDALAAQRGAVSVLPAAEVVLASTRGLDLAIPASGMVPQGLAVALVAGRDSAAARRVHAALVSVDFATAMIEANLVPAPRAGLSDAARGWMADKLRPYQHAYPDARRWLAQWRDAVRGQGRDFAWLELLLDALFAAAFVVFLFVLYRRMQRSDPKTSG